jgi:hypothetical protein
LGLANLKQRLTKAELAHNVSEVKKLRTKIFEAIFKRKEKGKSFKGKHVV